MLSEEYASHSTRNRASSTTSRHESMGGCPSLSRYCGLEICEPNFGNLSNLHQLKKPTHGSKQLCPARMCLYASKEAEKMAEHMSINHGTRTSCPSFETENKCLSINNGRSNIGNHMIAGQCSIPDTTESYQTPATQALGFGMFEDFVLFDQPFPLVLSSPADYNGIGGWTEDYISSNISNISNDPVDMRLNLLKSSVRDTLDNFQILFYGAGKTEWQRLGS